VEGLEQILNHIPVPKPLDLIITVIYTHLLMNKALF